MIKCRKLSGRWYYSNGIIPKLILFPLDGSRRLAGDVVGHPVDAADLVDDPGRDSPQEFMVEWEIVGGHAVDRRDSAEGAGVVVSPLVTHDADSADRKQDSERLPDGIVEAGIANLLQVDLVGFAQDGQLFRSDIARNADGESRPREGVAADEAFGKAKFAPQPAHFVLEEFAQRLDQLQLHALGQAADIVVGLDGHAAAGY